MQKMHAETVCVNAPLLRTILSYNIMYSAITLHRLWQKQFCYDFSLSLTILLLTLKVQIIWFMISNNGLSTLRIYLV